jgi:hypothetical protein
MPYMGARGIVRLKPLVRHPVWHLAVWWTTQGLWWPLVTPSGATG